MLVASGMGVVGGGVVPAPVSTSTTLAVSSNWDRPWQCLWVPFYSQWNPQVCQNYPNPTAPVAPVVPVQNPDGTYSVDQVVSDTAMLQQQSTQGFMMGVADQLGLNPATCDPEAFWCNYGTWLIFGGIVLGALYGARQLKGLMR